MILPSTRWEATAVEVIEQKLNTEGKQEFDNAIKGNICRETLYNYIIQHFDLEAHKIIQEIREQHLIKNCRDIILILQARARGIIEKEDFTREELAFGIAREIQEQLVLIATKNGELFVYDDGVYVLADNLIHSLIEFTLNSFSTNKLCLEVFGHIKRSVRQQSVSSNEHLICFLNGVLNIKTKEFVPHNPNNIFFSQIPILYNDKISCPKIKKFLQEIVNEQDVLVLEELAGYCLLRGLPVQKAFMLVGSGANGKSTFINLLRNFLGMDNVVSISLQELEINNFARARLHNKLACLFPDLTNKALFSTGIFKALVGDDTISAERKFKDGFELKNTAKLVFSCNQVPRSPDDSDAYFRRWVVVNFPNQFVGSGAKQDLLQSLISPSEMSGFLNLALIGLQRLLSQGDFSKTMSINEGRELILRLSDPVGAFVLDRVDVVSDKFVAKKELYAAFVAYCKEVEYPLCSDTTFFKHIPHHCQVSDYKPMLNGKRVYSLMGICLRQKDKLVSDNPDTILEENVQEVREVQDFALLKSHGKSGFNVENNIREKVSNQDTQDREGSNSVSNNPDKVNEQRTLTFTEQIKDSVIMPNNVSLITQESVLAQCLTTPRCFADIHAPFALLGVPESETLRMITYLKGQGLIIETSPDKYAKVM